MSKLTRRAEFLAVAKGQVVARGCILIQRVSRQAQTDALPSADIRVGFTATRKIGGAVVRNRCKRRMREVARALLPLHGEAGHDYVLVARQDLHLKPFDRLLDDVKSALIRLAAGETQPPSPRHRRPAKRPSAQDSAKAR